MEDNPIDELDRHLIFIWQTLREEREGSARFIEGLIGELRDTEVAPERRLAAVGCLWWSLLGNGRNIYDVVIQRDTFEERRDANAAFFDKVDRVNHLLERHHPMFGRQSADRN